MIIRDAEVTDAAAIVEIYAPFVCSSSISFEALPPTVEEMAKRIEHSTWRWPWLVCELDGRIAGYSYARPFRTRSAYQFTAETTVYVDPSFKRQGAGLTLMQHLQSRLLTAGHRVAVAGITLPNESSVALHDRLGFKPVGVFPSVGRKFQAWHDVGFWSLELSELSVPIPSSATNEWRMRVCPATSVDACNLIDNLTAEIAARYDHQGDGGASDFVPENFDQERGAFVIGWSEDLPVACGAVRPIEDGVAEIKRMYVLPEQRGKKYSLQVLSRLEVEAVRLGYHTLRLETGNRQPEAIGLYTKSGFQEIECYGSYANNPNSICFEKRLGE